MQSSDTKAPMNQSPEFEKTASDTGPEAETNVSQDLISRFDSISIPAIGHPPRNQVDNPSSGGSTIEDVDRDTDHFYMYIYKVAPCLKNYTHDWSTCPFAHKGEKATRRDPLKFSYMASNCPDHKDGNCQYGDSCLYSHGVFESCLHPERYKTQMCNMGAKCNRPVCFFAHSAKELRSPYCSPCKPQAQMNSSNASTISAILGHSVTSSPMKQQQQQPIQQQPVQNTAANPLQNAMNAMQDSLLSGLSNGTGSGDLSGDILNQAASLLCALQMMGGEGTAPGPAHMAMAKQNALDFLRNGSNLRPSAVSGSSNVFGGLHHHSPWQQSNSFSEANGLHQTVDWKATGIQGTPSNMAYSSLPKSRSAPVPSKPDAGCSMDFLDSLPDMTISQHEVSGGLPFYNLPQHPFSYLTS